MVSFWEKIFNGNLEFYRFGIISIVLIIVSCLSGSVVGLGALDNLLHLSLLVSTTMATLIAVLAVFPVQWVLNFATIAILLDFILLIYYLV
jgi:hypothetical protein